MNLVLPLILILVSTAVAAVPATILVRTATRSVPTGALQTFLRLALVTPIAIGLGLAGALSLARVSGDGPFQCLVCTRQENHSSFAGIVLRRKSSPPTEFETWYLREIGRDHDHDWTAVGCHWFGTGYAHHRSLPGYSFFRRLPKLEDQELAVALATRLLEADASDRESMLIATRDGPFHILEGFETAFGSWLDRHPEWR